MAVKLEKFTNDTLREIWHQGFTEESPEWKQWDGPYFEGDYTRYETYELFCSSEEYDFFMNDRRRCILFNNHPVGMLSYYWEDEKTRWLNIGISIYDPNYWSGGIGTQALALWIDELFAKHSNLEHIGLVTWSGNHRMMKAAEKIGMTKEAQIRKVRYWNGVYYDSISYGILRDENIV